MTADPKFQRLVNRRQFVLGPRFLEGRPDWTRLSVRPDLQITAHPDLAVQQVVDGSRSITLLGFILNAEQPEQTEDQILRALLAHLRPGADFGAWLKQTFDLAGRWLLIVDDGVRAMMVPDAMGLRQAYFTDPGLVPECWCATQPGVIAETVGLKPDPVADREFVQSESYQSWPEHRWPADTSPFCEVVHLLPNHYLELPSRVVHRFWPIEQISPRTIDQAATTSVRLMQNIMNGFAARSPLALGLSAGWDSRLILAASRHLAPSMYFYTIAIPSTAVDARVAPTLLAAAGLKGHLFELPDAAGPDFTEAYRKSGYLMREVNETVVEQQWLRIPPGRLNVTGNGAEVTRARVRPPPGTMTVTEAHLARFTSVQPLGLERNPFCLNAWRRWLGKLVVPDGRFVHGVHILDLFYWEQYGGNFCAVDQAEVDLAIDTMTPFNCRSLLVEMLGTPEELRLHDTPLLYQAMIRRLWPELLNFPVNTWIGRPRLQVAKELLANLIRRPGNTMREAAGMVTRATRRLLR